MQLITMFKIRELDNGWQWPDIETEDDVELFCSEELEIPHEFLERVELREQEIHVTLSRDRSFIRDDWYVNLSRISHQ